METLLRLSALIHGALRRLAQGRHHVIHKCVRNTDNRQEGLQPGWTEPTQTWKNKELTFSQTLSL